MEYQVTWTIEVDAESFEEAAQLALEVQRDPSSTAIQFVVEDDNGEIRELDFHLGKEL